VAPTLSLVLPVFNEEEVLPALLERLRTLLDRLKLSTEVIFVDDGSADRTLQLLRDAARADPRLRILSLSRNFGHQPAISAGLDHALGEAVVVMDADLQDPPEVVLELVARWREGFDVVHARRRRREHDSVFKAFTARLFYRLFAFIVPIPTVPDAGDFRLMSRRVVLAMRGLEETHRFLRGLVAWVGFRQTVVEYDRPERGAGSTKFSVGRMAGFAMDGITSFSTLPLRLATYLGLLVGLFSLAVAAWALEEHFIRHVTIQGWTSLMIVVTLIAAAQFLLLGIVGSYVGRIYEQVKRRPLYIVAEEISAGAAGERERGPQSIAR
jgi:polyisoprenyl-phosphate glycosyltransferase